MAVLTSLYIRLALNSHPQLQHIFIIPKQTYHSPHRPPSAPGDLQSALCFTDVLILKLIKWDHVVQWLVLSNRHSLETPRKSLSEGLSRLSYQWEHLWVVLTMGRPTHCEPGILDWRKQAEH